MVPVSSWALASTAGLGPSEHNKLGSRADCSFLVSNWGLGALGRGSHHPPPSAGDRTTEVSRAASVLLGEDRHGCYWLSHGGLCTPHKPWLHPNRWHFSGHTATSVVKEALKVPAPCFDLWCDLDLLSHLTPHPTASQQLFHRFLLNQRSLLII